MRNPVKLRGFRVCAEAIPISVELRRILSQAALSRRFLYDARSIPPPAATKSLAAADEISVFLLSKKLTLDEDRLVKQIVWDIKKTESVIRLSRSGSKASHLPKVIRRRFDCRPRARGRW